MQLNSILGKCTGLLVSLLKSFQLLIIETLQLLTRETFRPLTMGPLNSCQEAAGSPDRSRHSVGPPEAPLASSRFLLQEAKLDAPLLFSRKG